jgi:hypothetical protein
VVDGGRGIPDISLSASVTGSVLVYITSFPIGVGWFAIIGTERGDPTLLGQRDDRRPGQQPPSARSDQRDAIRGVRRACPGLQRRTQVRPCVGRGRRRRHPIRARGRPDVARVGTSVTYGDAAAVWARRRVTTPPFRWTALRPPRRLGYRRSDQRPSRS